MRVRGLVAVPAQGAALGLCCRPRQECPGCERHGDGPHPHPGRSGMPGAPTPRQSQPRCCSGVTLVLHPSLLLAGCPAEHALGSPGRWPGSATEAETERVPLVPKAAPQPKASVQPRGWQGPRTSGWSRAPGPGLQGGSKTFPRVLERSGKGLAAQLPPLRS